MTHSTICTIPLLLNCLFILSSADIKSSLFNPSNSSFHNPNIFAKLTYQQGSEQTIFVHENNPITSIDIYDNMIITMDIKIHQLYNGYSQNIFHIGNARKNENYPAIFMNKKAENGLKIRMTTDIHPYKIFKTYKPIKLDTNYHLEISYSQHSFSLYLNDEQLISENHFQQHPLCTNKTVYVSDPWHKSANAYISNLQIFGWNDVTNSNSYSQQESDFFLQSFYDKYLSGSWTWGAIAVVVLICNIGMLWYLNCSSFVQYKKETKRLQVKPPMTVNDVINLKIKKMQNEAAHEIEYSSSDDLVISYDDLI